MTWECSVCAAFHRWLEEKEEEPLRRGLLVELAFLDGFVKGKGREGLFSTDFTKNPGSLERMMGTMEFRKYLDAWVASQHLEESIAEELRWKKWEQLMQAAAFYIRFLKSYDKHRKKGMENRRMRGAPQERGLVSRETRKTLTAWLKMPSASMSHLLLSLPEGREEGENALWAYLPFRRLVELKVFDFIDRKGEISFSAMEEEWAKSGLSFDKLEKVLSFLSEKGLVRKRGKDYVRTCFDQGAGYPTARCFLESMESERYRMILSMRLEGCSLKAIGEKLFITRERVRQIAARLFEKRPHLAEDELAPEWQAYRALGSLYFRFLFNVPLCTVNYLSAVYGRGILLPARERQLLLREIRDGSCPEAVKERATVLLL